MNIYIFQPVKRKKMAHQFILKFIQYFNQVKVNIISYTETWWTFIPVGEKTFWATVLMWHLASHQKHDIWSDLGIRSCKPGICLHGCLILLWKRGDWSGGESCEEITKNQGLYQVSLLICSKKLLGTLLKWENKEPPESYTLSQTRWLGGQRQSDSKLDQWI